MLALVPPADAALRELVFFPFEQGKVEPAAPQPFARADDAGYRLKLAAATQPVGEFARLAGVLVSPDGFGRATGARAVTIDVPIAGAVTPAPVLHGRRAAASLGLVLALVFAFAGGLVLNLMPCVLPVLSIKVLGFAGRHDDARRAGATGSSMPPACSRRSGCSPRRCSPCARSGASSAGASSCSRR